MVKVSVIVPVYNAEKHIHKCLQELLNQTYKNYEVIFVNDGSTDESVQILNNYINGNVSVAILNKENGGQASARNLGLKHAKGEFVCFVDIDDHVKFDMLEKLVFEQEKTNADIVWCDAFVEKNGEILSTLDQNMKERGTTHIQYILNNAAPWRKLIRKTLLVENDLFFPEIRFYEDMAVVPAYALYADKIAYVKEALYYYVLHEGSTMHQKTYNAKLECIFDAMECLKVFFTVSKKEKKYQEEIEYLYIDHLLHAACLRFFEFEEGKESLLKISELFKLNYSNWSNNKYLNEKGWKYKLICSLFYNKKYSILKLLLK